MASARWTITAVPDEVLGIRRAAAAFAHEHGVPEPVLGDLQLAISEAVTNAVVHAYRDRPAPGPVEVAVEVAAEDRSAEVRVADEGDGMLPREDSPGLGLGLPLIARLVDDMHHGPAASGAGTVVWMRFRWG